MDYIYGAGVQQMIDAAQSSADIDAVNAAWQVTVRPLPSFRVNRSQAAAA